ncbi:MAG: hypothetical protein A4E70_00433 [Syntrophus sp. PtaU1.Bin005]|nr:MAG: hypothetical protein A4E70_00433 [Syntrophus sp. PtaU1.Bin005]
MGRVEGRLFDLCVVVFRVLVQFHDPHFDEGIIAVIPDLGQVKGIVGMIQGLLLRHDLDVHGPARKITVLDAVIEIPLIAFPALGDHSLRLRIGEVFDPLLGSEVELDPVALVFRADEAEGVAAEAVHVAKACRNAAVAHHHGHLMEGLGQGRPEVPHAVGVAQIGARVAMDDMVEVREFERVAEEENGRVVAHQVPVAFLGVEFKRKTANVPLGVGSASLSSHRGKACKHLRFFADLGKYFCLRVLGDVMGDGEGSVGAGALGVHPPFGNHLPIEMRHFFQVPDVLQKLWPSRPGGHNVVVVDNGGAGPGR